jgi:hypothetical protein
MPIVLNKHNGSAGVYIGRPSKWGNPFEVGKDGTRAEVLEKYRAYIFENEALMQQAKQELKGKNLTCWCAPLPCHGDILMEIANPNDDTEVNF